MILKLNYKNKNIVSKYLYKYKKLNLIITKKSIKLNLYFFSVNLFFKKSIYNFIINKLENYIIKFKPLIFKNVVKI